MRDSIITEDLPTFPASEDIFDNLEREDCSFGIGNYDNPMFDPSNDEDVIDVTWFDAHMKKQAAFWGVDLENFDGSW